MANSRFQIVYSEPRKVLVKRYLTPRGEMLLKTKQITKKDAWKRYGKNRYRINPNAVPVKVIKHIIYN